MSHISKFDIVCKEKLEKELEKEDKIEILNELEILADAVLEDETATELITEYWDKAYEWLFEVFYFRMINQEFSFDLQEVSKITIFETVWDVYYWTSKLDDYLKGK